MATPPQPGVISAPESRVVDIYRVVVRRVGLEIQRLGAGLRHRVNDLQRALEITIVVSGHFGDNERALVAIDRVRSDAH